MKHSSHSPWERHQRAVRNGAPRKRGVFRRERLPKPEIYFGERGYFFLGEGDWQSTFCMLCDHDHRTLRVHVREGAYRCDACGAHGGDIIAFHMQFKRIGFIDAAKQLGAWEENE